MSSTFQYDLKAYATRINYTGSFEPTMEVLEAIVEHHCQAIPFENFDVLLQKPIDLSPERLQEKLIVQQRGGYCFEQNSLMLGILQQIGFTVRTMSGRVRLESPREVLPPRTHLFLIVTFEGREWLVDVGVGGFTLTSPIRFVLNVEQQTKHETRRIIRENEVFYHQAWTGKAWLDVYEFTGEQMPQIDREVANWWTSTNPHSKFRKNVLCSMAGKNGERLGILNNRLTRRKSDVILEQFTIESQDHLIELLYNEFNLTFPSDTRFRADNLVLG